MHPRQVRAAIIFQLSLLEVNSLKPAQTCLWDMQCEHPPKYKEQITNLGMQGLLGSGSPCFP